MTVQHHKKSVRGFSLIELLVVIALLAALLAMLLPALSRARLQAKILVVNQELAQIGLALEAYEYSNNSWPPTRWDCQEQGHFYSLPSELVKGGYIPLGGKKGKVKNPVYYSDIEDKFFPGHTYKYIAPGPAYDNSQSPWGNVSLYLPPSYPARSSSGTLIGYSDRRTSPVKWVLFSLGPRYDISEAERGNFPIDRGFPVLQDFWYNPRTAKGVLTRIKMQNQSDHIGTFRKDY